MLRTILAWLAFVLVAGSVHAGEFSDDAKTFRLRAPDGWITEKPPMEGISLVVVSPRRSSTGGNCNVIVSPVEATAMMSQAEVEAQASAEITEELWRQELSKSSIIKSFEILESGNRTQRGRKVFFVKINAEYIGGITLTQLQDIHPTPGRFYIVTCTAATPVFDREEGDILAIMTSFEPLPSAIVAGGAAQTSLAPSSRDTARQLGRSAGDALKAGQEWVKTP